jgi:hypothetical protein
LQRLLLWPTPDRLHDEGWIDQMILIIGTMARSIAAMNTGQGRDLLGVCELARLPRMREHQRICMAVNR